MEPIHAVVEDGTDALAVEGARVAGVLPPRRRTRIGVVGDRERQRAVALGGDDLGQPTEPPGQRRGRCAEQQEVGRLRQPMSSFASSTDAAIGFSEKT